MKGISIIIETKDDPLGCIDCIKSLFQVSEEFDIHIVDRSGKDYHYGLANMLNRLKWPRRTTYSHHREGSPGKYGSLRDMVAIERVENPNVLFLHDGIRFRSSTKIRHFDIFLNSMRSRIVLPKIYRNRKIYRHAGFLEYDKNRTLETLVAEYKIDSVSKHPLMSRLAPGGNVTIQGVKVELGGQVFAMKRELLEKGEGNGRDFLSWDMYLDDPAESFFTKAKRLGVEVVYSPDIEIDMIDRRSLSAKFLDFVLERAVPTKYDLIGT